MAAPARADGPRGGRVECRRPPRAEAAHVRRPRAPPMLSAGHGHDCFCASRWPRATRLRAADRMVALLPTLSRAGPPPVVARAVCETFTHASITGVVFRPPARRIRWLQVRSARTACRPNRISPCRGIARALCVCRELAQVQLLRLRLHQPPARPSSRPQVRTARNMCRSARTHTMRWRCTRSLTACHRVWPVLCAHCAGVQQDALARNDLSLTEGRPRVGVEMTNAHARAPTRAQLLNRVNPSTCERSARKNGSLSSLLAACRTVAIFARPR
jgi:hypothetical protein